MTNFWHIFEKPYFSLLIFYYKVSSYLMMYTYIITCVYILMCGQIKEAAWVDNPNAHYRVNNWLSIHCHRLHNANALLVAWKCSICDWLCQQTVFIDTKTEAHFYRFLILIAISKPLNKLLKEIVLPTIHHCFYSRHFLRSVLMSRSVIMSAQVVFTYVATSCLNWLSGR